MPVSHLSLTVSHLPSSCSFYLATLQPLGHRYIGQHNNHVGFGVNEADFFICQESPSVKPTAAHIAFNALSRKAVDDFFSAALKAGGTIHDGPAVRDRATGYYSAAVIDFDGNSIEVVHRDAADQMTVAPGADAEAEAEGVPERAENASRAVDGESSTTSRPSPLKSLVNNIVSTTNTTIDNAKETVTSSDNSKALVGTLLGAAAGAAIAFAMTRSEKSDRPRTPEYNRSPTVYQTVEAPPTPRSAVSHRSRRHSASYSEASGHSSRRHHIRMIESPPSPPSEISSRSTIRPKSTRAIEAPPSPPLSAHRKSHLDHEIFSRTTMPPPASVETYYTVEVEPARSGASRSSRKSERSHRSRRHSFSSSHRPDLPPATPAPPDSPAIHKTPADFPLPPSAFSTPLSTSHKSRSSRTPHVEPASATLHGASKTSHASHARSSRAPDAYPLPSSAATSYISARSSHRREPHHTHTHEREPESYPLPPSAKTSFVSHLPPRRARSVTSHSSQSTVKPLTKANLGHQARSLVGAKAATDIDDAETLAPDDSISQASGKERRRVRRRRREEELGRDGRSERGSGHHGRK